MLTQVLTLDRVLLVAQEKTVEDVRHIRGEFFEVGICLDPELEDLSLHLRFDVGAINPDTDPSFDIASVYHAEVQDSSGTIESWDKILGSLDAVQSVKCREVVEHLLSRSRFQDVVLSDLIRKRIVGHVA